MTIYRRLYVMSRGLSAASVFALHQGTTLVVPLRRSPRISCGTWWRWRTPCCFPYRKQHTRLCPAQRGRKSGSGRDENSSWKLHLAFPNKIVIPSVPGFPASPLLLATTYVVLPKENHMQSTEAAPLDRKSGVAEGSAVRPSGFPNSGVLTQTL
jgi:hypothetical protein